MLKISNFSSNSKPLTSHQNLSSKAEMIKPMNLGDGNSSLDTDPKALSNNLEVANIGEEMTSHFAFADSKDKRDDESPIETETNNAERNLLENLIEELSPIQKSSQSRLPLIKRSLPPFSPIRSEETSNQARPQIVLKLEPGFLNSRRRTEDTRLMSLNHPRRSRTRIESEGYSHLPLIDRNTSQTLRVHPSERVVERSFQRKRLQRILPSDHDQPSGSRLPASVDFSGRIARMKQELAAMRQACS